MRSHGALFATGVLLVLSVLALSCSSDSETENTGSLSQAVIGGPPTGACPADLGSATFPSPVGDAVTGGFGATSGTFDVGPSGEPVWSLPLSVPPGPPGMTPSLSLQYRPGSGQEFMASGWTLGGLSSISRCPKSLAHEQVIDPVHLDPTDSYCLDGQRLVEVADGTDSTEYRTQPDTFVRVLGNKGPTYATTGHDSFEVITPAGTHKEYGGQADPNANVWSSKLDSAQNRIALAWLIRHESAPGTTATIDYRYSNTTTGSGTSAYFPTQISYSGRTIGFETIDPSTSDPRLGWQPYRQVANTALLSTIIMATSASSNHVYSLNYAQGPRTGRTLLTDIQESVTGTPIVTRSIAHFEWGSSPATTPHFNEVATSLPPIYSPDVASVELMDVSGDGLPDFVSTDVLAGLPIMTVANGGGPGVFHGRQLLNGPPGSPSIQPNDLGIAMDYDQDGLDDLLLYDYDLSGPTQNWKVLRTVHDSDNVVSYESVNTMVPRVFNSVVPKELRSEFASAHLADINGDGVVDLVQCLALDALHPSQWTVNYWVPSGSPTPGGRGFEGAPGHPITGIGFENYPCDVSIDVVDIDGDHRAELVVPTVVTPPGEDVSYVTPYLAFGTVADGTWESVNTNLSIPVANSLTRWVDVNGDGLPDAIQNGGDPDNLVVFFNKGSIFPNFGVNALATPIAGIARSINSVAPIDLNGDGRQDLLVPLTLDALGTAYWLPLQSTGSLTTPFQPAPMAELDDAVVWTWDGVLGFVDPSSGRTPRVADLDGDGATDILMPTPTGFSAYFSTFAEEDTLKSVTNGTNARVVGDPLFRPDVAITYGHLIDRASTDAPSDETSSAYETFQYLSRWDPNNTCDFPRHCVVGPRRVVTTYDLNNGQDGLLEYNLFYRDGRSEAEGRGWIGFGSRLTVELESGASTFISYDNINAEAVFGDYSGAGVPQTTRHWIPASTADPDPSRVDVSLEKSTRTSHQIDHPNFGPTYFPAPASTTSSVYQEDFAPGGGESMLQWVLGIETAGFTPVSSSTTTYDLYDNFGNLMSTTSSTVGVDLTTVRNRTYFNDTTQWILGRPLTDNTCSTAGGDTQCRLETATYDSVGRVLHHTFATSDTHDPTNAANAAYFEDFIYDGFGNTISLSKTDSHQTAIACVGYDAQGVFPKALRDPLGYFSYLAFDPRFGEKIGAIDPNQLVTQWSYDRWGRPAQELRADGRNTVTTFAQVSDPTDGLVIQKEVKTNGGQDTTTQYDEIGRPRIVWSGTVTPVCGSPPCTKPRTKQYTIYDPVLPVVSKVSIPVDESVPIGAVTMWNSWVYDHAGRVVTTTPPWAGGTTTYQYSGSTTTIHEPLNVTKSVVLDQLGRTVQMNEPAGSTTYSYGPFSQITKVVALGSETDTWSDALGDTTYLKTPDTGVTTSTYDGFRHPLTELDAAGRVTTFNMDVAGRPLSRTDVDGVATWTWDTAVFGIGKVTSLTTAPSATAPATSREDYSYTSKEQLASQQLTVGGESFLTQYHYDVNGNIDQLTYPPTNASSPFTITNTYDPYGNLVQVTDKITKATIWTLRGSDNEGHTTLETFGNGVSTARSYFLDSEAVSTIKSGTLQNLAYTWDARLNLHDRKDNLQTTGNDEVFTYDTSDRVTCASFDSHTCSLSVAYDASGNITNKSGLGVYQYDPQHPHAVQKTALGSYSYSAVGNQIQRPSVDKLIYNAVNLPRTIDLTSGAQINYAYNGLEQRIQKTTSTGTTVYAGGLYERVKQPSGVSDHYYSVRSGERVVAVFTRHLVGTTVTQKGTYLLVDHLGSPDVLTDDTGAVLERRSFDAFGQARPPTWSSTATPPAPSLLPTAYTGQENDALSLIDMKGRTYDPQLGRFLQADPYVTRPGTLQGWNRYAYVENNPLKNIDPTGFGTTGIGGGGGGPATGGDELYASDTGPSFFYQLQSMYGSAVGALAGAGPASTNDTAPIGTYSLKDYGELLMAAAPIIIFGGRDRNWVDEYESVQQGIAESVTGIDNLKQAGPRQYAEAYLHMVMAPVTLPLHVTDGIALGPRLLQQGYDAAMMPSGEVKSRSIGKTIGNGGQLLIAVLGAFGGGGEETGGYETGPFSKIGGHHIIQDAAVRELPGYSRSRAPAVDLGPINDPNSPHRLTREAQQAPGGGTYGAERQIAYQALTDAGVPADVARTLIGQADDYFRGIGVTNDTPTRIPGDRR